VRVTIFDYGAGNLHSLAKALAGPRADVAIETNPVRATETDVLVLPGVGAFTTYKADLEKLVTDVRARGGMPVLVTSMNRKSFDATGHVINTLKDYPDAVRAVAREMKVALIDLNAISKTLYEAIGKSNIGKAFVDGTHHNAYGSYELAKSVVEGIRQNKLDLASFIAGDVPDFDPAHPDPVDTFHIPASPRTSNVKPLGN